MLQKLIDSYAEEYMMLDNDDRRIELRELQDAELHMVNVYWIVFIITVCIAGFCGWLLFIGNGQGYNVPFVTQGFIAALVFFPILLFIEIAWARSSVKACPMYVLLITSGVATALSKFVLIYLAVYSVYFVLSEMRLIGMKILPGYPAFADIQDSGLSKKMTYQQMIAYDKKRRESEKSLVEDAEELEKLLKGELDLDSYLGVVSQSRAEEMEELALPDSMQLEEQDDTNSNRKGS